MPFHQEVADKIMDREARNEAALKEAQPDKPEEKEPEKTKPKKPKLTQAERCKRQGFRIPDGKGGCKDPPRKSSSTTEKKDAS